MEAFETRAAISRFLFVSDAPEAVDLVFVFGSPTISTMAPAIALFRDGLAPKILISGKGRAETGEPEWSAYRAHALAAGVPEDALLIEPEASNTSENAAFGAALIERTLGWDGIATIAVCAKPFHMRRALMTARRHFPAGIRLIARPPSGLGDVAADDWWQSDWGRQRVLEELGRISAYALKGDLGDV